jgi:hypothetical protein
MSLPRQELLHRKHCSLPKRAKRLGGITEPAQAGMFGQESCHCFAALFSEAYQFADS